MNIKKRQYFTLLLALCIGFRLSAQIQHIAKNETFLGTIVQTKKSLYKKTYATSTAVKLNEKVALSTKAVDFTEKTYRLYKKAMHEQGKTVFFEYQDSIAEKPTYITLKFADKVGLVSQLQQSPNKKLLDFIGNSKNNQLITEVAVLVQQPMYDQILYAERIFLNPAKAGGLSLRLQNGEQSQEIKLNQLQLFGFNTAKFCWAFTQYEEGYKIVDILEKGQSCAKGTKDHPRKLSKTRQQRFDRF